MKEDRKRQSSTYKQHEASVQLIRDAEVTYDAKGRKKNVILPYKTYEELIRIAEDVDDRKLMDAVAHENDIDWEAAKSKLKKK